MKYVALLRGINVGGNNMIKMETLREVLAALGFENVKSYINSGNLVFETKKIGRSKVLAKKIHEAILKAEFGFDISVMVRPMSEIEAHNCEVTHLRASLKATRTCIFSFLERN